MPEKDYTQKKYADLVQCLAENYSTFGILNYTLAMHANNLPERFFIVRHDVDANIRNALEIARIDAQFGIQATFYFRVKPFLFNIDIIKKIKNLGHEVGYHYEVLSDTKGDMTQARMLFETNLNKMRSFVPVTSVCMHGRSLSPHNNLDFWNEHDLEEFDLVAEPYLTIDYSDMYYFSDTSRCWNNSKYNLRDIVDSLGSAGVTTTDELITFFRDTNAQKKGALLTHSNFWTDDWLSWWSNRWLFFILNRIKLSKKKLLESRKP